MDIAELIDLSNIKVISTTKNNRNHLIITIETTELSVACHTCGKQLTQQHGYDRERKLRHLPVFGKQTTIVYKPHRYICENCDNHPTTTATPDWHKRDSSDTIAPISATDISTLPNQFSKRKRSLWLIDIMSLNCIVVSLINIGKRY